MRKTTPRTMLEKGHETFSKEIEFSESFWGAFAEVVGQNNYVSAIARKLKKNKSLVSRQLNRLARVSLVASSGAGVKQFYEVDWNTFTIYWIWSTEFLPDIIGDLKEFELVPDRTPNWLSQFYLSEEENKQFKGEFEVFSILEPVIPQLSQIVQRVIEVVSEGDEVRTFYDAYERLALAFGLGLPEKRYINSKQIDIASSRQLVETLYHPKVQVWFKQQAFTYLAGSNIVRNYILRLAGLIRG